MAILTRRDRIAVVVIMAAILLGWGIRLFSARSHEQGMELLRNAVQVPVALDSAASEGNTVGPLFAPLDINSASLEELQLLPQIGPTRAEAIIRYRQEHGAFGTTEDIMQVPGIGPGIYERIRTDIVAGNPRTGSTPTDSLSSSEK